ncbi:hypothetical protein CVT26_012279 [Gymnopilus dilepis]|uniref:Uncharacterized protein n=1 Tax=Gymnopilus dilepis TaxID=231916 RepID=A0A409YQB1_9AGAR|nr:hypothetical protein CVT26_012279 [Gymnopilus dilepis]
MIGFGASPQISITFAAGGSASPAMAQLERKVMEVEVGSWKWMMTLWDSAGRDRYVIVERAAIRFDVDEGVKDVDEDERTSNRIALPTPHQPLRYRHMREIITTRVSHVPVLCTTVFETFDVNASQRAAALIWTSWGCHSGIEGSDLAGLYLSTVHPNLWRTKYPLTPLEDPYNFKYP